MGDVSPWQKLSRRRESTPKMFTHSFFLHLLLLFSYRAKLGGRRRGFLDTDDVNYLLRVYYVRDSLNYGVSRSAKKSRVEVQEGEREKEQRSEYAKGYLVIYKSR